jgi:hypothetical protein
MPNDEQFMAATAGATEYRDVNIRNVPGGFVLNGQRRWLDENGTMRYQLTSEYVTSDGTAAAQAAADFFSSGKFA